MAMLTRALLLTLVLWGCAAQAQTRPAVSIDGAAWLAGRWQGEGLGGQLEEAWTPPQGGQMAGYFRFSRDGVPQFYEFALLDVVDGGIRMRVKHFDTDMVGWEDRDGWHAFDPISVEPDGLTFDGLSIRREGSDRMVITIRIRRGEEETEEVLRFERAPL